MYSDIQVIGYRTHIEVYPYKKGMCEQLERVLSKYDYVCHKWIRVGYYIHNDTLYIPRGVSLNILAKYFNTQPILSEKFEPMMRIQKAKALKDAKSQIQQECMDFLLCRGEFSKYTKRAQMSLNAD